MTSSRGSKSGPAPARGGRRETRSSRNWRGARPSRTHDGGSAQVTISELAAGGDGVGRLPDGRVAFVPQTAPGDVVDIDIVQAQASFVRGRVRAVVQASAQRVTAPCAAFTAGCGGCQWLHVDMATQHAAKRAIVSKALRHVLGDVVVPDVTVSAPALGWRRRARVHVQDSALGFLAAGSHDVVDAPACVQVTPAVAAAMQNVRAQRHLAAPAAPAASSAHWRSEFALVEDRHGVVTTAYLGDAAPGVAVPPATGPGAPELEIDDGVWIPPAGFAQASSAGNAALVAAVGRALHAAMAADGATARAPRVLELYAGAGNFTRAALAAGCSVTAVDFVAPVRWEHRAAFIRGDASEVAARMQPQQFEIVLLDPPRQGAREVMPALLKLAPASIIYVSCDPATLARDLGALRAGGYELAQLEVHDTMPNTAHVEVVTRLQRVTR